MDASAAQTESGPLRLRPARRADGAILRDCCFAHIPADEFAHLLADSLKRAATGRGLYLVAELDGQIAGSAQILDWPHGAEIADLAVAPAFRRRGIGRALVEALLEHARARDLSEVEIGVEADNQGALALYRQLGFELRRSVELTRDGRPVSLLYLSRAP